MVTEHILCGLAFRVTIQAHGEFRAPASGAARLQRHRRQRAGGAEVEVFGSLEAEEG